MAETVDLFVPLDELDEPLGPRLERALGWARGQAGALRVVRRSLDARKGRALGQRLRVLVARAGETIAPEPAPAPPPRWPAGRTAPRVVVVGSGMIGVLVIQVLREKRCRNIIAIDVDADKLALAKRVGAARTINATDIDVPAAVRDVTDGQGADASFEVVGHGSTVMNAIRSLRKGGTVVLIGNLSPKVEIPLQEVVSREISVLGSCASSGEIPECIDLLARGAIDVDPLISLKASLDDAPGLFERLYGGDKRLMKVIIQP